MSTAGTKVEDGVVEEIDPDLNQWILERANIELRRLEVTGQRALLMTVRNYGLVIDKDSRPKRPFAINRIEVQTGFNFDLILQIMVSPPLSCPLKPHCEYRNVLLFTDKPLPILLPYLYCTKVTLNSGSRLLSVKNDLSEWLLINEKGQRSRQQVDSFH